jgi:hypothetical protein
MAKYFILMGIFHVTLVFEIAAASRHVDVTNSNPVPPYADWATAATNVQDAIDVAADGDLILVADGVYASEGRILGGTLNCVVVDKAVTVQSVNGFAATVIDGRGAMRGVYLTNGAVLDGFTVTNGYAINAGGGGVLCASTNASVINSFLIGNRSVYGGGVANGAVSNCIIEANISNGAGGGAGSCLVSRSVLIANSAGEVGGGASGGISVLNDCLVISNHAAVNGGGVFGCVLNNCVVVSNTTLGIVGGAYNSPMKGTVVVGNANYGISIDSRLGSLVPMTVNSIIYYNQTGNFVGAGAGLFMTNNCTTPLPTFGSGNFTNAPAFVDMAAGDFRLQTTSPCINAGNSLAVTSAFDFDGNPRIVGGAVDVGAFEFQTPTSMLSYAWAQKYGLSVDGSADFDDADADGFDNYSEWRADTIPTNALSALRIVTATNALPGVRVVWQSVGTRHYWLERSTNLNATPLQMIATNIAGAPGSKSFLDTTATNHGSYFYRVGVQ